MKIQELGEKMEKIEFTRVTFYLLSQKENN